MTDRQPTYPGRVKLIPVEGQKDVYDMERADEPVVVGTPLNKGTLLADLTCAVLGLPTTAVPNDAFLRLALPEGKFVVRVSVVSPGGLPLSGITIQGLETINGGTVVTGDDGTAIGFTTAASPVTITAVNPFLDISGNVSASVTLATDVINECTLTFVRGSATSKTFTASTTVRFSPDVDIFNCSAIGGGNNGAAGTSRQDTSINQGAVAWGGKGGNAGAVANAANLANPGTDISVVVGGVGGTSKIGNYITATGGGGAVGGNGAYARSGYWDEDRTHTNATNGGNTTGFLYPATSVGGAGGGGGAQAVGGEEGHESYEYGQAGSSGSPGYPAYGSGGSGGSGYYRYDPAQSNNTSGGPGMQGLCGMTWSYKN